jgi:pimeloyl-ACP methyl ester carboxylesterase
MRERTLRASRLDFTALEAGRGPLVLCLHGFPDTRHTYRGLVSDLAKAGYRAVAPQLRGYEHSSNPRNDDFYLESLAVDVLGWIEDLGEERAHLIGHDWGAPIAYAASTLAPESVVSVTAMSVPHLRHFRERIWKHPSQLARSSYMALFQIPGVSERIVQSRRLNFLRRLIGRWSPDWTPPEAWLQEILNVFSDRELTKNALAYYRCGFDWTDGAGERSLDLARTRTSVPVLSLVGEHDGCMAPGLFETMMSEDDFSGGLTLREISDAGHFLHLEQPERVTAAILDFIRGL